MTKSLLAIMTQRVKLPNLRDELLQLFGTMESVREELANFRHLEAPEDRLKSMADQLDKLFD